jgi:hypothetical protein
MYNDAMAYQLSANKCKTNGCVYTIKSFQTDLYYIGSTYQPLYKRFFVHKSDFKNFYKTGKYISSFEILKYDDAYIEILEKTEHLDRSQLFKRENELIREHINAIVNVKGNTHKKDEVHLNELKELSKLR